MSTNYEELKQTVEHHGSLPQDGNLSGRTKELDDFACVWNYSLSRKDATGFDTTSYARFRVYSYVSRSWGRDNSLISIGSTINLNRFDWQVSLDSSCEKTIQIGPTQPPYELRFLL